jgi:hypothetical protein
MSLYNKPLKMGRLLAATPPIDSRRRTSGGYVLPPVSKSAPPTDRSVYNAYDNKLNWIGWMEIPAKPSIPWFYSISYKTGGSYVTKVDRSCPTGFDHGVMINEKNTGKVALYFATRKWTEADLIDDRDTAKKIEMSINELKGLKLATDSTSLAWMTIPDKFKLLPPDKLNAMKGDYARKLQQIEFEFRKLKGQAGIDFREALIDVLKDQADAHKSLKQGEQETGFDLGA